MWHLLIHAVIIAAHSMERKTAALTPYKSADFLESELKQLKETLARGDTMRKQTQAERAAEPSTYGYARFPLTEDERRSIEHRIRLFEEMVRRRKSN